MDEKQILDEVEELVHSYHGVDFIDDISRYLSHTLKMDHVLVGRTTGTGPDKVETKAYYQFGQRVANFQYELKGTPCEKVLASQLLYYPHGIQSLFPKGKLLRELYIESYIGQPLISPSGSPLGIIALLHQEIIPQAGFIEALLSAISLRAEQELRLNPFQ
jgi:hypothetical protein